MLQGCKRGEKSIIKHGEVVGVFVYRPSLREAQNGQEYLPLSSIAHTKRPDER